MKKIEFIGFDISGEKVIKRMSIGLFLFALVSAKGVFTFPIYTRILGTHSYGILSLIFVTANILFPLVKIVLSYGFRVNSIHLTDKETIRRNFLSTFYPAILFTIANLLLFSLVDLSKLGAELNQFKWLIMLLVFSMVLKEYAVTIPETYQKAAIISAFTIAVEGIGAVGSIIFVLLGYSIPGILLPVVISYIVGSLILLYLIFLDIGFEFHVDFKKLWKYLLVGLPVVPVGLLLWLIQSISQYFITYYYSPTQVGIFAAATTIASFLLLVNPALDFAFGATILKLWNEKRIPEFYQYNTTAFKWLLFIVSVAVSLLTILSYVMVKIFASEKFLAAVSTMPLIAVSTALFLLICQYQRILYVAQKTTIVLVLYTISGLASLSLNILLIPKWGIFGAAIASVGANFLSLILFSVATYKNYKHSFVEKWQTFIPVLYSIVFCLALQTPAFQKWHENFVASCIIALVYILSAGLLLYISGYVEPSEFAAWEKGKAFIRSKIFKTAAVPGTDDASSEDAVTT